MATTSDIISNNVTNTYNDIVSNIKNIELNDVVKTILYLFLVLYASFVRPELPRFLETLFKNNLFRLFVFFLIAYLAEKENNYTLALLVALVFFVTMNYLTEREVETKMTS
jgi:hypothetical protein